VVELDEEELDEGITTGMCVNPDEIQSMHSDQPIHMMVWVQMKTTTEMMDKIHVQD
jgi:hypothetical protein